MTFLRGANSQKPVNLLNSEMALKLYARLISPGGPVGYLEVAELLGVVPATVHRQCTGDIPVQCRTIAALHQLDLEGALEFLRILAEAMGQQTHPTAEWLGRAPTLFEALQAIANKAACSSEGTALAFASLHDGRLEPHELAELEAQWAREDAARQAMRDSLAAMVETVRGGGQLGRLEPIGRKAGRA